MNKKILKKLIIIFSLILILSPVLVSAALCSYTCPTGAAVYGKGLFNCICVVCYTKGDCYFYDILIVAFNAFNFLRNNVALPIAVLMVVIGGGMMIFSGGSKKMAESGRKTFQTAIVGFLIVFGVSIILNSLLLALTLGEVTDWIEFFKSALLGTL